MVESGVAEMQCPVGIVYQTLMPLSEVLDNRMMPTQLVGLGLDDIRLLVEYVVHLLAKDR